MKFKKVELHAFRAYKNKENGTFDFTLDNGKKIAEFISIYAPNGFGKTSFYDGVEWGITNRISRLDTRNYEDETKAERKHIENQKGIKEPQYVLKNKDSAKGITPHVKIWTDSEELERKVNKIRAGGKDYPPKTKKEKEYFSSVILSQDGIDNFLKADTDKERYDKFIANFGDKSLSRYHQNIEILEKYNKQEKDEIKRKITNITDLLQEPIDKKIYESANKEINELNKNSDDKLDLIDDGFNKIKKGELEIKLKQQKSNLVEKIEYYKNVLFHNLPNWIGNSQNYFKSKNDLANIKKKLKDFHALKSTHTNIKFLEGEILEYNQENKRLETLKKYYPTYKSTSDEVSKIEKRLLELDKSKITNENKLYEILFEDKELSKQIELLEKDIKEIADLLIDIPKIFEDIENIINYQSKIKSFQEQELQNSKVIEAVKNNIFIDLQLDKKYKTEIKVIESLIEKNNFNNEMLVLNEKKKLQHQDYNRQIRDLLAFGIRIINDSQSDTCPLCNTQQDSYEILKNKVLNNPLLNSIEKELLEKEEKIQHDININVQKIEESKKFIISDLKDRQNEIQNSLETLRYKLKMLNVNSLEDINTLLSKLILRTENMKQEELVDAKTVKQKELKEKLAELQARKKLLGNLEKEKRENILLIDEAIKSHKNNIQSLKSKQEYLEISKFISRYDTKVNILEQIEITIDEINQVVKKKNEELSSLNNKRSKLLINYDIKELDTLDEMITELKDEEFKLYTKEVVAFESSYEQFFNKKIINLDSVKKDIKDKKFSLNNILENHKKQIESIDVLANNTENLLKFIENKNNQDTLREYKKQFEIKKNIAKKLSEEKKKLEKKIENDVQSFFYESLINQIYEKIDPHPDYKNVQFKCQFENGVGKLYVFVSDEKNEKHISPSLYYSTAQLNVLSLSIFLAKALNAKDDQGNGINSIFIDDPIQAMDSINILATIDLLRSFVVNHNKQIILSTHDENFHRLLERKIPTEYFNSKFIELETFGKVRSS